MSTRFFKEGGLSFVSSNNVFLGFFQKSSYLFTLFFKGFYNQNLIKNIVNTKKYSNNDLTREVNDSNLNFKKYESLFISIMSVNKSNFLNNKSLLVIKTKFFRNILKLFFFITTTLFIGFIFLYGLVVLTYKYNLILPKFISISVTNVIIFFFSFVISNTHIETQLIPTLLSIIRVNYNNLESNTLTLKVQEKYFSKFENTYFTDKKCSDVWVGDYYIPGYYLLEGRVLENFYINQKFLPNNSILLNHSNTLFSQNVEEDFITYNYKQPLFYDFKSMVLGLYSFETQKNLKTVEFKEILESNNSKISPLKFKINYNLWNSSFDLWKPKVFSLDFFQKNNFNLDLNNVGSNFFLKTQINLNKFFIQNTLYGVQGLE